MHEACLGDQRCPAIEFRGVHSISSKPQDVLQRVYGENPSVID